MQDLYKPKSVSWAEVSEGDLHPLEPEDVERILTRLYDSPIRVMEKEIAQEIDENTYKSVIQYGIDVDREELLKALAYDREQYAKGFRAGVETLRQMLNDVRAKLERAVLAREERAATNPARWIYTQLGRGVSRSCSYSCEISCPICGATYPRLDGVDFAFCPNCGKPIEK